MPRARKSSSDDKGFKITSTYEWRDSDGEIHVTDAAGLPPELRGPDGRPRPPADHPIWQDLLDAFYEALSDAARAKGLARLSRDQYWWLWEHERDEMQQHYQRWLGQTADDHS